MRKISRRPGHRSGNAGHRRRVHTLAGPHRSVSKLAALAAIQKAREASLHRKSRRLLWALPLTFDPGSDRTTLGRHAAIPPERHHQWRFASCHEVQDSSLRNVVRTGRSDAQFLDWEFAPLPRFESQHDPMRDFSAAHYNTQIVEQLEPLGPAIERVRQTVACKAPLFA